MMADKHTAADTDCLAVVIPCYRVSAHVLNFLRRIGPEVERIYCIDDILGVDERPFPPLLHMVPEMSKT